MAGVGRKKRCPVRDGFSSMSEYVISAKANENQKHADLHNHDRIREPNRLPDADNENSGDEQNSQKAEQIKRRILMRKACRVNVSDEEGFLQLCRQPFPVAVVKNEYCAR